VTGEWVYFPIIMYAIARIPDIVRSHLYISHCIGNAHADFEYDQAEWQKNLALDKHRPGFFEWGGVVLKWMPGDVARALYSYIIDSLSGYIIHQPHFMAYRENVDLNHHAPRMIWSYSIRHRPEKALRNLLMRNLYEKFLYWCDETERRRRQ
jgi:hypothetical protein